MERPLLSPEDLLRYLQQHSRAALELRINENRSSMLRASKVARNRVRLSIHRMFLEAPPDVLEALVRWVGGRSRPEARLLLRRYINTYEGPLPDKQVQKLEPSGAVYDLREVFAAVNREYFGGELDLGITWFGRKSRRMPRSGKRLGEYCISQELVRIHRQLDDRRCPWQYLHFVVYHEMLHHVLPPEVGPSGRLHPHHKAFRKREREFAYYDWAIEWEKSQWGRTHRRRPTVN